MLTYLNHICRYKINSFIGICCQLFIFRSSQLAFRHSNTIFVSVLLLFSPHILKFVDRVIKITCLMHLLFMVLSSSSL